MTRVELAAYLTETYGSTGEHLFAQHPSFLVLDGTVNDEKVHFLVDVSYELTKK